MKKEEIFKINNYAIVKDAVSKELCSFVYSYFQNKRTVTKYLHETKFLMPFDETWGTWTDNQIPDTYSHYSDIAMETLMVRLLPLMQSVTQLELIPAYTYARIYKYGDILHRHKDRPSCQISTTVNLGGDPWPIFLEPSGKKNKPGVQVDLNAGDMLVYRGDKLEHWRDSFQGYDCGQVFLHFVDKNGKYKNHAFDGRPFLGLPGYFRKND